MPCEREQDEGVVIQIRGRIERAAIEGQFAGETIGRAIPCFSQKEIDAMPRKGEAGFEAQHVSVRKHVDLSRRDARAFERDAGIRSIRRHLFHEAAIHAIDAVLRPPGQGRVEHPVVNLAAVGKRQAGLRYSLRSFRK